jgi:hypothetical protein
MHTKAQGQDKASHLPAGVDMAGQIFFGPWQVARQLLARNLGADDSARRAQSFRPSPGVLL